MSVCFYNDILKKIEYNPLDPAYDFSSVLKNKELIQGEEYVCLLDEANPRLVLQCHKLKSMDFEIKSVREFSPSDNIHLCAVKVLSYEEGTEYPKVENVVVSGYFYNAYPEAVYESKGYWDVGKDGRDIFCVTERTQIVSSSENSVKKYLSSVLKGTGVGKQIINRLFEKYEYRILDVIKENEPSLASVVKSDKKRAVLVDTVRKSEESEKSLNFLLQNNVSAEMAIDIIKKIGSTSFTQINKNPYILLRFESLSIDRINSIAKKCGLPYHCKENIEGLILRFLHHRTKTFGDIYIDRSAFTQKNEGINEFESFYDKNGIYKKFSQKSIFEAIDRLAEDGLIVVEPSVDDEKTIYVYDRVYYDMENDIVRHLLRLKTEKTASPINSCELDRFIDDYEKSAYALDEKQRQAVHQALGNKISIISGGPGSGKTFVTRVIVEAFKAWYPEKRIQLCAPTGKASRRMSEVIGMPACTIHKKLGYGTMLNETIEEDLLIVDECSMIDIELFHKLLSNTGPKTSIVLVGDYNQLPSVGPGLILRDLMDSRVIPCTLLQRVFRQSKGSEIVLAARQVLESNANDINRQFGKDFVFIEQQSKREIYENLSGCIKYLINHGVNSDRIQIITPQNEGLLGTNGLNTLMRDLCNPNKNDGMIVNNTIFYPSDRIIETENNSDLGIYNGSMGTIISIDRNTVIADFDGRIIHLSEGDMRTIKLGYAISVHRAQGAEFDYTFMPLIREHEFTLNKNLLYTAITRAKKMFVLLGESDVLRNTIHKEIVWDRKSQIRAKLSKAII